MKILLLNLIIISFLFSSETKEEIIKQEGTPTSLHSRIKKQVETSVELLTKEPIKNIVEKVNNKEVDLYEITQKQKQVEIIDNVEKKDGIKEISTDDIKLKYSYFNDVLQTIIEEKINKNPKNDKEIQEINYKIEANKTYNNNLAVIRDKLKITTINNRILFNKLINNLIEKRKMYSSKKEILLLIEESNEKLLNDEFIKTSQIDINKIKQNNNITSLIEQKIVENYNEYLNEKTTFLLVNRFLIDNVSKITKTNFFIDKVNIDYVITNINNNVLINNINPLIIYYTKTTFGEILIGIVFSILILSLYITVLPILIKILNKIINKDLNENESVFKEYILKSLKKPILYLLILISIEVFLMIVHNNQFDLEKQMLLISTLKMFVLIWMIYNLTTNYIEFYSEIIFTKYPNMRKEMILFVKRIIVFLLFLIGSIMLLSNLGFNITALLGGLGILGVGFSLAFKDTFANFLGSINILFDKPFSPGDWIFVSNEIEGTVIDIRMRTTRIRTFDNTELTIPNSNLANSSVKNYGRRKIGRRIKFDISITYESSKEGFKQLIKDIKEMLMNNENIANEKDYVDLTEFKIPNLLDTENLIGIKRNLNVNFTEFTNNAKLINIYCFSKSVEWEEWREIQENILFEIERLVEKNDCKFAYPTTTQYNK